MVGLAGDPNLPGFEYLTVSKIENFKLVSSRFIKKVALYNNIISPMYGTNYYYYFLLLLFFIFHPVLEFLLKIAL